MEKPAASLILLEKHFEHARNVTFWLSYVKPNTSDQDKGVRIHSVRLIGRA